MKIRQYGIFISIIFFFIAGPVFNILKSAGVEVTLALIIEGVLAGIGLGWLLCFLLVMKYLPK